MVPVDIKNGPQYSIEFSANLTIPEITLSTETIDFDRVCVNTRKTIKIRLENKQDVPCEWNFHSKSEASVPTAATTCTSSRKQEEVEKFHVWPHSGVLVPGQRQTVDVMFIPSADKLYTQKLAFKCNQNPKLFILNVTGQGINYTVEMVPFSDKPKKDQAKEDAPPRKARG